MRCCAKYVARGNDEWWLICVAMLWLIVARAVQGIGAGSILGLTQIVISDIVSLEERGKYAGFIGATVFNTS
jgi:MFS family permease